MGGNAMTRNSCRSAARPIRLNLFFSLMLVCASTLLCAQTKVPPAGHKPADPSPAVLPTIGLTGTGGTPTGFAATGNGIEYHGGPLMITPHNVYFIWYGNWSGNTATTILPAFISGLSG